MTDRNTPLVALRPEIQTQDTTSNSAEQFQNEVLRPIIKFQDVVLVQYFKKYIIQRKNVFHQLPEKKKLEYIDQSIRKDQRFKHLLLGLILGLFQESELKSYFEQEAELSRRITNLIIQRLQSHLHDF